MSVQEIRKDSELLCYYQSYSREMFFYFNHKSVYVTNVNNPLNYHDFTLRMFVEVYVK